MTAFNSLLRQSLETGFIDDKEESLVDYRPRLLTNDFARKQKVLTTINKELKGCEEFYFSVAFLTTGGVSSLIGTLLELEEAGIKGKILVSQYLNFTQPEALRMLQRFSNIELRIVTQGDFHSKGYIFKNQDFYTIIIGSSNLTSTALTKNKEWNLKVTSSHNSEILIQTLKEFDSEFEQADLVTDDFLERYSFLYNSQRNLERGLRKSLGLDIPQKIVPNTMQTIALSNIQKLRDTGKNKALLISATGTGKTFLSAFDVQQVKPKKFLFIVHRTNIALKAKESFEQIIGHDVTYGMFSGATKDIDKDYLFSTVQTFSKTENLEKFSQDHFDYIVIDETHRANASSYAKMMEYFKPKFLLGMTATPERTDGLDVFSLFDYNIAYEIRLHQALEENMLVPFHYYGVADIEIDGELLDEKATINQLSSNERVDKIIEKAKFFGCDNGRVKGLIFCSRKEVCYELSDAFNSRGFKTIALTSEDNENSRASAIDLLEAENDENQLDYIFTVDIFNEGIDIPKVNQIIMLRPTESAIIFIQQLGRGLRKAEDKSYLTVIDFIGNYKNNFLVPIALFGDNSYNKDTLRKLIVDGNTILPGSSTIYFDRIIKEKIFKSIDVSNLQQRKDLINDYKMLKFKLGRIPMMNDFITNGSRDPYSYAEYAKSYFNFVASIEKLELPEKSKKLLELFSTEINNSKRIDESLLLQELMENGSIGINEFNEKILKTIPNFQTTATLQSLLNNLNFGFITEKKNQKLIPVNEIYGIENVVVKNDEIMLSDDLKSVLFNSIFNSFLKDSTRFSINKYLTQLNLTNSKGDFILYRKYSRKDVFRLLNWNGNPVAQNVGGYMISSDGSNCAIFVNYHKSESISETTKYDDGFINQTEFKWMSKSNRNINSKDVQQIINANVTKMRLPLFVKKHNDEGADFYYMGELSIIEDSVYQDFMMTYQEKKVSVVKMHFKMNPTVESSIYNYIISNY